MNRIPLTRKDHAICDDPMACEICMTRCYNDSHFINYNENFCDCGEIENKENIVFKAMFIFVGVGLLTIFLTLLVLILK